MTQLKKTDEEIRQEMRDILKKMTNEMLAKTLEVVLKPLNDDERIFASVAFSMIVTEAESRVGHLAREIEAAEDAAFQKKFGIREDMSSEELDAIFDKLSVEDLPRGTAPVLVEALRK